MGLPELIYLLCAATSLLAAGMLLRYYLASRTSLLLWSCVGFLGLAINNVLVYLDLVTFPTIDLALSRTIVGAAGILALVYGLTKEAG